MHEINKPSPRKRASWQIALFGVVAVGVGIWIGREFFPVVQTKIVVRRVEVPVLKVVEKWVEAPTAKLDDGQPEIEVPVGYTKEWVLAWAKVTKGLSRAEVLAILGSPMKTQAGQVEEWYYFADTQYACVFFFNGTVIHWNGP